MKPLIELKHYLKIKPAPIVEVKREFREKIKNRIFEKYVNYTDFAKVVGIPYNTFYNNLFEATKSNRFRLDTINKTCRIAGIPFKEMEENIILLRPRKYKNFCLPFKVFSSPELANLVGHAFSDGYIEKTYTFSYTNKSPILQKEVKENISKVFGMKIRPKTTYHKAFNSKYPYVVGVVLNLLGVPVGNKTSLIFNVPKWIKNGNLEIKRAFIRALFDDEASIKIGKREIIFKMAKISILENELMLFLESVISMLRDLGVNPSEKRNSVDNRHTSKTGIETIQKAFGIHGNKNFEIFRNKIGFLEEKKSIKLSKMVESCQKKKLRSYEGQEIILENLRVHGRMTKYEISEIMNISPFACYKHLIKLQRSGIVIQMKNARNMPSLWTLKK